MSSFFEKNSGQTFLNYYNDIRLTHAVNEMLSTDSSIESIALANGFTDVRGFTSLFKKRYGILPSAYRKDHALSDRLDMHDRFCLPELSEQLILQGADAVTKAISYECFMKYQSIYQQEAYPSDQITDQVRVIDGGMMSFSSAGIPLTHNFHTLLCVGSARQFLFSDVQDMLRRIQKEIGYKYVKFHGILSDEMMVYSEDAAGNPRYSFTMVDKIIDFMLSIGLKPFCQLSFMPAALASEPEKKIYNNGFITSPPKDLAKWQDLIREFTAHMVNRYGLSEVRQWLFTVWNEPDGSVTQFSFPSEQEFFDFFEATYRAVKSVDEDLLFGTPSLMLSIIQETGWAKDFFLFITERYLPLDFLNIHFYDNSIFEFDDMDRSSSEMTLDNMDDMAFPLTTDPYAFMKYINSIKKLLRQYGMKDLPIYLSEWNLTISHRDLINDTCFKACYLTKNLLENYDRLESFGYWVLTDMIEELQLPGELYHGGLGMFTYNGIPKSHYNAFRLIGKLKDELVGKGDGYFITKKGNHFSMIVYNYEHYTKLFASGMRDSISAVDRYNAFSEMNTARFTCTITGLDKRYTKCLIRERYINQTCGSSYDAWIRMGSPELNNAEDLEILKQQSEPGLYIRQGLPENGEFIISATLAPLEVRLIELEFIPG